MKTISFNTEYSHLLILPFRAPDQLIAIMFYETFSPKHPVLLCQTSWRQLWKKTSSSNTKNSNFGVVKSIQWVTSFILHLRKEQEKIKDLPSLHCQQIHMKLRRHQYLKGLRQDLSRPTKRWAPAQTLHHNSIPLCRRQSKQHRPWRILRTDSFRQRIGGLHHRTQNIVASDCRIASQHRSIQNTEPVASNWRTAYSIHNIAASNWMIHTFIVQGVEDRTTGCHLCRVQSGQTRRNDWAFCLRARSTGLWHTRGRSLSRLHHWQTRHAKQVSFKSGDPENFAWHRQMTQAVFEARMEDKLLEGIRWSSACSTGFFVANFERPTGTEDFKGYGKDTWSMLNASWSCIRV